MYLYSKGSKWIPNFKTYKGILMFLLVANSAGFKLSAHVVSIWKPMCIEHQQISLSDTTVAILKHRWLNWNSFLNSFIPQSHEYLLENGIPFKMFILLDNMLRHSPYLDNLRAVFKAVYMFHDTLALFQPRTRVQLQHFQSLCAIYFFWDHCFNKLMRECHSIIFGNYWALKILL